MIFLYQGKTKKKSDHKKKTAGKLPKHDQPTPKVSQLEKTTLLATQSFSTGKVSPPVNRHGISTTPTAVRSQQPSTGKNNSIQGRAFCFDFLAQYSSCEAKILQSFLIKHN